ncbi:MAG: hypothetical protein HY819_25055 [Acidobacteria bacterium]|nr:hypothetical protein [Acidobacteriota bacterium]
MKTLLTKDQIKKGVELAFLIYPEKEMALKISLRALSLLEHQRVKEKRWLRDYLKVFRDKIENLPNYRNSSFPKIYLNDFQLYQQLIMQCANKEEKQQESTKLVNQQLLTIRYLKHLVVACLDKNLLFLVVALTRVLHKYSTNEAKKVCLYLYPNYKYKNLEFQIKRTKSILLKELAQRFQGFVKVVDNRFASNKISNLTTETHFIEMIGNTLNQLVLWDTECLENMSAFSGSETLDPLSIGRQMCHVIIHPDCYSCLIEFLGLENSNNKLEIPNFFTSNNIHKDDNDPFNPPDFTDDIPKLLKDLEDYKQKVKNSRPSRLAIFVDDKKRGVIELDKTNKFFLKLINEGKLLEIYDEETNLLLLSRHLSADIFGDVETKRYIFPIINGQHFNLIIKYSPPTFEENNEDSEENIYGAINTGIFEISIACYETNPLRAIVWSYKRLANEMLSSPINVFARLAITIIILIILGFIAFNPNKILVPDGKQQIIVKDAPTPKPSPKIPNDQVVPQLNKREVPEPKPHKNKYNPSLKKRTTEKNTKQEVVEREPEEIAMERGSQRATLATIKTIYVSDSIEVELRKELIEALKSTGRFTLIKDSEVIRTQPDATIEWALSQPSTIILSTNYSPFIWKVFVPADTYKHQAENIVSSLMQAIQTAEKEEIEQEKKKFK